MTGSHSMASHTCPRWSSALGATKNSSRHLPWFFISNRVIAVVRSTVRILTCWLLSTIKLNATPPVLSISPSDAKIVTGTIVWWALSYSMWRPIIVKEMRRMIDRWVNSCLFWNCRFEAAGVGHEDYGLFALGSPSVLVQGNNNGITRFRIFRLTFLPYLQILRPRKYGRSPFHAPCNFLPPGLVVPPIYATGSSSVWVGKITNWRLGPAWNPDGWEKKGRQVAVCSRYMRRLSVIVPACTTIDHRHLLDHTNTTYLSPITWY